MNKEKLRERCYEIGNSEFPIDEFYNDIRDNSNPNFDKESAYKDLEKIVNYIEKLEKENQQLNQTIQTIRQNARNDYISHQEEINNSKEEFDYLLDKYYELGDENTKLKKVIKILKRFDFDIYSGACSGFVDTCIKEPLTFDLDNYEELQQYELLKEVFKDE